MIKVYHVPIELTRNIPFSNDNVKKYAEQIFDKYELVAGVSTDSLDLAFQKTNHIENSWYENQGVTVMKESRSTSVGDLLETDAGFYVVGSIGFLRIQR